MELLHTAHVPAGDGPFPTVIALHGWGASAHDLFGLAPYLHGGEALVLCPQGPLAFDTGGGVPGYGWFPLSSGASFDPALFERALATLRGFVSEVLTRYPADARKVALMGFSQGGVMAYALALREPDPFIGEHFLELIDHEHQPLLRCVPCSELAQQRLRVLRRSPDASRQ